jgi:hypothetical protein
MAQLSKNAFLAKYNDGSVGLYKTGQVAGIGSDDHRSLVQDIFDSLPFLSDATEFSVPFNRISVISGAADWDWVNGYFNIALISHDDDFEINFSNQVLGAQGTLFVKKDVAGDIVITVPTHQSVGSDTTTTTITLSGTDGEIFRIDFFKSETSSFVVVATSAVTFTKMQHLSSTVVLAISGDVVYKSTDGGLTFSLAYTSPDDSIVDFHFTSTDGVLVSRVANGSNYDFNILTSSDSGDNWSAYSMGSTLVNRNTDHIQKVIYYSSGVFYTFGNVGPNDFNPFVYRVESNNASIYTIGGSYTVMSNPFKLSTDVWAVVSTNNSSSKIIKRTGSNTWSEVTTSPIITLNLLSIAFATSSLGLVVGSDSSGDPSILKSVDGGATWAAKTIDVNIGIIREVGVVSATSFVVMGDNGIGYSTDSGETWIYYQAPFGGAALSSFDSNDILIAKSTEIYKGFGTTVGDILHLHGQHESTTENNPSVLFYENSDWVHEALTKWGSSNSGTSASAYSGDNFGVDSTEKVFGAFFSTTGTDTNGRATLNRSIGSSVLAFGFHRLSYRTRSAVHTLSDGTDTFTVYSGWGDNAGAGDMTDGAYFRYTHSVNSGRWEAVTAAGATRTATDTGIAADTTFHVFEVLINEAGTSVEFYIDGALVATNTTNIPTGTQGQTLLHKIEKSAGTTARKFYQDWYDLTVSTTTAR